MADETEVRAIEANIRDFISAKLLYSQEGFAYPDDASLLREGIIDSVGVVELVGFVQSRFGVHVGPHEVRLENFDSVAKLTAFIRRKQGLS